VEIQSDLINAVAVIGETEATAEGEEFLSRQFLAVKG